MDLGRVSRLSSKRLRALETFCGRNRVCLLHPRGCGWRTTDEAPEDDGESLGILSSFSCAYVEARLLTPSSSLNSLLPRTFASAEFDSAPMPSPASSYLISCWGYFGEGSSPCPEGSYFDGDAMCCDECSTDYCTQVCCEPGEIPCWYCRPLLCGLIVMHPRLKSFRVECSTLHYSHADLVDASGVFSWQCVLLGCETLGVYSGDLQRRVGVARPKVVYLWTMTAGFADTSVRWT